MLKNISRIIAIFIVGVVGGIFADQILWPYFIERPFFYQYRLEQSPVYVTERKEITVEENVALRNAIEKVEEVVAGVRADMPMGKFTEGSGLVITSDGLIVTLAELVPQGSQFSFFVEGKKADYQILKRDFDNNLALIKIEATNLQTCSFADLEKTKLGERVFLVGTIFEEGGPFKFVNEGIIKSFDGDFIQTNIFEKYYAAGSPLFNIKGEVLGLNTIDKEGKVITIPISKIREFTGF
jgi:S1-C subfamily serine protease